MALTNNQKKKTITLGGLATFKKEMDKEIAASLQNAPTYVGQTKSLVFEQNAPVYSAETKSLVFV